MCDDWGGDNIRGCFQSSSGRAHGPARTLNECLVQPVNDELEP